MIHNTHEQLQAAGGGVAIIRSYSQGRGSYFSGYHIYRVNAAGQQLVTNPNAAWYDNGCKSFVAIERDRGKTALTKAKAWVKEKGLYAGEWKRNSMGDYLPADIAKRFPIEKRIK